MKLSEKSHKVILKSKGDKTKGTEGNAYTLSLV